MAQLQTVEISKEFVRVLKAIFELPASISIITGYWKTGKTDFALYMGETLLKLRIIEKLATNIETPHLQTINDMVSLKHWFFKSEYGDMERRTYPLSRAYIYDEAIESTPSRRAMGKLNTAWLMFIPQISKARGHLIVIAQESDYMESSFVHPTYVRAYFHKVAVAKTNAQFRKMVRCYIPNEQESKLFLDIPPTTFNFDPYLRATFTLEPNYEEMDLSDDLRITFDYAHGLSSRDLVRKYSFLHSRKECMRRIRLGINELKASYQVQDKGDGYRRNNLRN